MMLMGGPKDLRFQILARQRKRDQITRRFFLRENLPKRQMTITKVTFIRTPSLFESPVFAVRGIKVRGKKWHYAHLLYMYAYLRSSFRVGFIEISLRCENCV